MARTYDLQALDILLSGGSEQTRKAKLATLAAQAQARIENRIECHECGSHGPHDDNGRTGEEKTYCCSECGNHFEG